MIKNVNEKEFYNEIKEGKTLVDFYANWCGPCKMLSPIIHELSEEVTDIKFLKVDIDEESELAEKYDVMSIPTIILFENGVEVKKNIGLISKSELEKFIKE